MKLLVQSIGMLLILGVAAQALSEIAFLPKTEVVIGGRYAEPASVSSGDFNGDGFQDLVVAKSGNRDVCVLINNGDGTFGPKTDYSLVNKPYHVMVCDLNADDHPDLATANGGSNTISVLYNNGDGTFAEALNYECYNNASCVAASDLDGDGDVDLIATMTITHDFAVYLNEDNTGFAGIPTYYGDGDGAQAVVIADFDHNNSADLAVVLSQSDGVMVWSNDGKAVFTKRDTYPVGRLSDSDPSDVIAGDFNHDNLIDLVTVNSKTNDVSLLLGNGNLTFQDAIEYSTYSVNPVSLVGVDLDDDTDLDIATANHYSNTVSIFEANGDGTFPYPFSIPVGSSEGAQPEGIHAADLNNDNAIDLVIACFYDTTVTVLINALNIPLSADDNDAGILPSSVELKQNYPNPFNPTTTIAYNLPRRAEVTLTVYNLLGQAIVTLIDGIVHDPGRHTVVWDGLAADGRDVATGMYFYQLKAGDFRQTRRMILLK